LPVARENAQVVDVHVAVVIGVAGHEEKRRDVVGRHRIAGGVSNA
jgi:hypothetical protein